MSEAGLLSSGIIVDAHVHIFPEEFRRQRARYCALDEGFMMIYGNPNARIVTAPEALDVMDKAGIDAAVVFGFPWRDVVLCREHNDYVWEESRNFGGRFIPVACVYPCQGEDHLKEARRCLEMGFRGIGEIAAYGGNAELKTPFFSGLGELLSHFKVPLILHVAESVGHEYPGKTPTDFKALYGWISEHQELDIVLAHWGGGILFYELMPEVRSRFSRVRYDTAASPFLYSGEIYEVAVRILGKGKILFGSDYPLINPSRYIKELTQARIPRRAVKALMGGNAVRLWNLPRPSPGRQ